MRIEPPTAGAFAHRCYQGRGCGATSNANVPGSLMPPLSRRSIRTSTPRRRAVRHRRLPGANARARRQPLRNLQEAGSLTDGQFTVFGNVELVRRREVLRRKPQVHDWDADERQHQRAEYAADDDDAEAGTDAGTRLEREGEREVSLDDRDAGHPDPTETRE